METILNMEDAEVRGRHGVVPVRIYPPPGGAAENAAPLVWAHGGAFAWGDLDMAEAHEVARGIAGRVTTRPEMTASPAPPTSCPDYVTTIRTCKRVTRS